MAASPSLTGVERRKLFTLRSKSLRSIRKIVTADDLAALARDEEQGGGRSPSRRNKLQQPGSNESSDEAGPIRLPRVNIDGPFPTATGLAAAPRYF